MKELEKQTRALLFVSTTKRNESDLVKVVQCILRNHLIRCLKRSNYDVSKIFTMKKRRKRKYCWCQTVSYEEGEIKEEIISAVPYSFVQEQKKEATIQP